MKLYYALEACSLADHIALMEAGLRPEIERVDLKSKLTETGADFRDINPKGYVPTLVLADGEMITENVAVLDWIADQHAGLRPEGPLGRTRLVEMLAFIATEIHPAFKPLWHSDDGGAKREARERIAGRLRFVAGEMQGGFLFGDVLSAADCYLYVMLRWARRFDVAVPESLVRLRERMERRRSVVAALECEGMFA